MKKGFTLIEIVSVIFIISILLILIMPSLLNQVNNKKNEISDVTTKIIYDAADIYVRENENNYPVEENAKYCIKLEELVNSGHLVEPVKDLKTNKDIPLNYYIKVTLDIYNNYDYELTKTCN